MKKATSLGPFAYIVVTTKNIQDVTDMTEIVAPAVTPDSTIVLIQNGIGIEREFFKKFPKNVVLSGVSLIQSINRNAYRAHVTRRSESWIFQQSSLEQRITRKFL